MSMVLNVQNILFIILIIDSTIAQIPRDMPIHSLNRKICSLRWTYKPLASGKYVYFYILTSSCRCKRHFSIQYITSYVNRHYKMGVKLQAYAASTEWSLAITAWSLLIDTASTKGLTPRIRLHWISLRLSITVPRTYEDIRAGYLAIVCIFECVHVLVNQNQSLRICYGLDVSKKPIISTINH